MGRWVIKVYCYVDLPAIASPLFGVRSSGAREGLQRATKWARGMVGRQIVLDSQLGNFIKRGSDGIAGNSLGRLVVSMQFGRFYSFTATTLLAYRGKWRCLAH